MTKKYSTKKALLMSTLSLLLCFSMLIGTTFAWFTDSVTSANNIIKSGNLDIELEYWDGDSWEDVSGKSDILTNTLWEPGAVEVAYLRVANAGSLALKYQLGINIVSETTGVNKAGEEFKLSDHIQFGVKTISADADKKPATYANRGDAVAAITDAKKISAGYTKPGALYPKDNIPTDVEGAASELYLALVVWMPTEVGNVANHNGMKISQIDLGFNIVATQMTAENDSFGNDYDAGARFDVVPEGVSTPNNTAGLSIGFEWALRSALANQGIEIDDSEPLTLAHMRQFSGKLDLSNMNIGSTITNGNVAVNDFNKNALTAEDRALFDGFTVPWAISEFAYGMMGVTELDLTNTGIEYIPSKFLLGNPSIEKITLPDTVVSIGYSGLLQSRAVGLGYGYNSFAWMKDLKTVNMPASLKYMADHSFAESPSLELNIETIPALNESGRKIFRVVDCKNNGWLTESKVTGNVAVFAEKNKNALLQDFIFEGTAVTADAAQLGNSPLTYSSTFGNIAGITGTLTIPEGATLNAWMFDAWSIDTLYIPYGTTVNGKAFANNKELKNVYVTYDGAAPSDEEKAAFVDSLFFGGTTANVSFATDEILNAIKLRKEIDGAAAGATITVEENVYKFTESLVITKPINIVADGNPVFDFSTANAPIDGGYNTAAAIVILSNDVTIEGLKVYGKAGRNGQGGMNAIISAGIDNTGEVTLTDNNIKVSDTLNYDFEWAVNEFAPDAKGVYENIKIINCTIGFKSPAQTDHGLFMEARYLIVKDCAFENIQAYFAVVKLEEDHSKVLDCTYTGCTGTECTVYWCGCSDAWGALGDGVEYDGHPFKCEEGWAGKSGDAYAAHVAYAEAYGWTHDAEQ